MITRGKPVSREPLLQAECLLLLHFEKE